MLTIPKSNVCFIIILSTLLPMIFIAIPHLGLSENSVPLHPMVNDHYPY